MLQPLGDRILIRPEENATQTASGLHVVEQFAQPEVMGTVAAAPERVSDICDDCAEHFSRAPLVNVGDVVVFSVKSGQEIQVDGERHLIMRESEILAVLEGVS